MFIKKTILFIFSLIICGLAYSQNLLVPLKSESFGLNHHTNRDIAYFSHVDSNNNTIIVATTERDSTFTDILTTKIDENYNLTWQKRLSIDTNLSYDIPVKSFLNSNNELYIIGRSSFNQSNSNGLIFLVKYSENGSVIFNKTLGNLDGSTYDDYRYLDANLNSDGSLSMVYSPINDISSAPKVFNFMKIGGDGNIINSFTKEIKHQAIIGKINSENFYFLTKEIVDENNSTYTYKFYRIQDENVQSNIEITDSNFINYYTTSVISDQVTITVDSDKNCYLTCHNTNDNNIKEKIHLLKIDSNNEIKYSLTTSDTNNYFLIGSFINQQNNSVTVANNLINNTIDFIAVDENNMIQAMPNTDTFLATGFKKNDDGSFFITTSNSNIRLFSNGLTELKSFNTSDTYELIDFSKVDENTIVTTGINYEKMFPESDYTTQLDIQVQKVNSSQILNNYTYSGLGTSRAFQQKVIIDNDNNYLVLVTEKMGPEFLGIGGQNPPLNKRIIKYNTNLEILWEVEFPEHILNVVSFGNSEIKSYLDSNNNLYLNLPKVRDIYNADYDLYKVTSNGNIEFINNSYAALKLFANESHIFIATGQFLNENTGIEHFILYKLDKNTGGLLEEIKIESESFLEFYTNGTDVYFYTYENDSNNSPIKIFLYKNNQKEFTRFLPSNYGIFPIEIDIEGTLYFATHYPPDPRINKIDINNSYSFYSMPNRINTFKKFNNENIFVHLDNNGTIILDKDLNFISTGEDINSSNPYLMTWGNYILFGTSFENSVRIIDQDGDVINYFKIHGILHDWYSKFDNQGNLIMVGGFGNRIYTFNEYSWYRGFIHNYGSLNGVLSNEDIGINTQEKEINIFPNPTSDILNIEAPNHTIAKIVLYDITGKHLKEFNTKEIDMSNFKSGVYLIKIVTKSNFIINSKIIRN